MRNVLSPYSPLNIKWGKPTVRRAHGDAGKGWRKSECRTVMDRIGIETSSYAKAGRLLQVSHHRQSERTTKEENANDGTARIQRNPPREQTQEARALGRRDRARISDPHSEGAASGPIWAGQTASE